MKRIITLSLLVILAIPAISQNTLTVHQKDGQQFSYGFEEKPVVTFTDNNLIIKSTSVEVSYELSQLAKFTFDNIDTDVENIKEDISKASITLDEYTVKISGAKPGITVSLISSDGKLLHSYKTDKEGSVIFSISELSEGTYIITSESLTFKVLKK